MTVIKQYNTGTSQWETIVVGATGPTGATGAGVAAGGSAGQHLTKVSGTDYDTSWAGPYTASKGIAKSSYDFSLQFVGCRLARASVLSIPNNSTTATVTFAAADEAIDTNAFHDSTTNTDRITVPTGYGGKYLITGYVRFAANATGQRLATIKRTSGATTTDIAEATSFTQNGLFATSLSMSTIISLAVGDYLRIFTLQNSGAALNVDVGTSLCVQYLGA